MRSLVLSNITIEEIAKVTGVSVSTVSRVINNKPMVKDETRKKVLACLEKHHYSPNETARGLVNQSSRMVGILLTDLRTTHHIDGIFYIQQELDKMGFCCIILSTGHEDKQKAHYIELLNQRRVEAAVLIGSTFECDAVKKAISQYLSSIPVFMANGYLDLPNVYGIVEDEMNGVSDCVKFLASQGRNNLAFLMDYKTPSNLLKWKGFKNGIGKYYQKDQVRAAEYNVGTDMRAYYESALRVCKDNPEIDGIICSEDRIAAAVLRALHELRVDVPEQVSVIGINNSDLAEMCNPTLTSLDNMWMDVTITIARNLIYAIQGRHIIKKVMVFPQIVFREST